MGEEGWVAGATSLFTLLPRTLTRLFYAVNQDECYIQVHRNQFSILRLISTVANWGRAGRDLLLNSIQPQTAYEPPEQLPL